MRINFKGTTKEGGEGVPYWPESQILEVVASSPMMGHNRLCWLWKRSLVEDEEQWEQYEEVSYPKIPGGFPWLLSVISFKSFTSFLLSSPFFVLWYIIRMFGSVGNWNQYWWFSSSKAVFKQSFIKIFNLLSKIMVDTDLALILTRESENSQMWRWCVSLSPALTAVWSRAS